MRFKDFIQLEDGNSQDVLFVNLPSKETQGNAPSDGQRNADQAKITAGARPGVASMGGAGGGTGGGMVGALMMKKFMKRFMKKMTK